MSLKNNIIDGNGRGNEARVEDDGSLLTTLTNIPPADYQTNVRPFRQYLTTDGTSSGCSDMRVNGSSTSVDFYITAPSDADRYVDTLSIAIADAGATLDKFGNINALSNGIEIFYEDTELGDVTIADQLTSNFEIARVVGGGVHGIGSGANAYRANNVQGSSEGYLFYLDFSDVFNIPWGIRLQKGTKLRLGFRINDNITGVDKFDVIAYGFDRVIK